MGRIPVAVLGATGIVGRRFVSRLQEHPWFEPVALSGSRSVGRRYGDVAAPLPEAPLTADAARLPIVTAATLLQDPPPIVFSTLPAGVAGPVETALAEKGTLVFTNARDLRSHPCVPILVPEINAGHSALVARQPWAGAVIANGNCSGIIAQLALAPLVASLGVEAVDILTLQALSGAGHPGVSALDATDNVLPHIGGEEEKLERETRQVFGGLAADGIRPAPFDVHATCTRVPVRDGHTAGLHVRLARPADAAEVAEAIASFEAPADVRGLPSSPPEPLRLHEQADRPQPRLDRDDAGGMRVQVGRIRVDDTGRHLRLVVLGHNAVRGAAGQSVLNAEHALAAGHARHWSKNLEGWPE